MLFHAEDKSRANYRSLFEYAAGAEARLAQDRRLAYYEQVLPEMLTRVKGLPLMYQTYSKGWNPADKRPEFIVKRLVPDLDKPIYITDDEGNKVQKGFEKQDLVMETDEDIPAFMTRKGRFKGQHGFNKGFSYLAPIYHVERDQMPFVLVDLDIDRADFSKIAWGRLLTAVTKVYDWFRLNGFDPLINFTGSSFHIWAKDGHVRSYAETKQLLGQLSKEVDLPLAAGAAHIKGQVTIDYPQNKYRAPLRFPLSIHGDTGLSSIIIPRNQLRKFDPLTKAHPDQVLKQLPNHLAKIDAWFSDLPQTKPSAEAIITAHLATLDEDDQERCMWGDCGVLADELMLRLQAAGHTDAMYEIGLAYIHPFEEYDDKTFIGGHVVVTVDGESYDVLGAGAKQRWVDGPVVQQMLSSHGFIDLGPLLSSHLTVNWVTSPWNEEHKTRSHNFAGKLVDFEAETEYKKKRQKPTPEPGVEGGTDLKPSRRKSPMKVKGSDVYSVQKHRATTRGSHRDIRIGLDGKLLSFVPVGRYEKKDDDGKWQKTDGSRLPKKIGDGVSVIRTEDHPFDYWWFEGEIPKDSYGAGPVSLETHGTRRIIEWKPDEKLKVEFIGGKYAGTYTFERSKKSKDGKVWWMRKSRPVPEDKTDKKTKKAEISDDGYCSECGEHWTDIGKHPAIDDYEWSEESVRKALERGPDEECWNCYVEFENWARRDEDEFDYYTDMFTQDVVDAQTVKKYIDSIHDGYFAWWDDLDDLEFTLQKVPLTIWDNIERSEVDGQWIDAPVYSHRLSDTLRQFRNQHPDDDYPPVVLALNKSGNYEVIDGYHRLNALQILGEEGVMAWVGTPVVNKKTKKAEITDNRYGKRNFTRAFSNWNVNSNNRNYSDATRYIDKLLDEAKYMQGKIILYRALRLANPEDFDPTKTGESWTPHKNFAEPYFGYKTSNKTYILTALVPVESVDWKESVARAFEFGPPNDEKEIVLKTGAPIELINLPMELSFAIDATPEALIRAAEEKWYGPPALETVMDEEAKDYYGHSMFSKALVEWSEKFLAGEGNAKEMIERAYYDDGSGPGDGLIYDYNVWSGLVSIESGGSNYVLPENDAIERFARRYVEELLFEANYYRGRIKLYRSIQLVNPEDFDPTEVGQSWTPIKTAAKPYFGFHKSYSRKLERKYPTDADSETYVLTALVPVESINWYYTLMRALSFGISDEKEIVLKTGAPIELVDIPLDLSFAIDGTPEALIRAAEEDDEDWWFTMNTPLGPDEEFGPYESHEDALKGIERVMQKVISLEDGYTREFPRAYQGRRGAGFGLRAEDIDLTVGEAFDKALAEIQADVEAVQPRSKDISEVTLEDYEKTKQVYQRFMIPAGITGSIVKDEWYYETEPIYLRSDIFKFVDNIEILRFGEWKAKIDAQRSETELDILASDEINYAYHWFMIVQINSIYNWLLSRLGERKIHTGAYAGPPVELPEIIASQRDATDIEIYRWLATSQDDEPVRRLRNRMRPVDVNYYGGYGDVDRTSNRTTGGPHGVRKGLEALSYGPCWSLSPDAYTRTDQWRLAQEDVVLKEREVRLSPFEKAWRTPTKEEIDVRTYVIEKSIPAADVDWYSTLISSALWLDSPEYEVIPKRGVFLSEEITDSSDFEQEFNKVAAEVTELFKEFSWFSDNQKELYDVSDLHDDEAGYARLHDVELHLAMLTRPGSLLWSSGDDLAYDAYPDDLRNPTYIFQDSGIFVDEDGETDGYTDEERGETYEEGDYFTRPFEESPDLDIRLRYAYTLNRLSKLAEQYLGRLGSLRNRLEPQFASGEVTLYRAFSLPEGEVPQLRRMTIFPLSMRIGDARKHQEMWEQRVKYNYESYGAHWSLLPGFEWSNDFPSHYGEPYIMEKQIPYTDVDWFTTLLVMAYGREPEWEVAVNENVFLAENEVKISLYHVTPLDQVGTILETGLEPRIGPRSERMELEPRIWLFGDQESVDQALMNWLGDEMYGAEWRSGYAVLRIDLPANWFKQRRVEKTFDPYGSERSWEWSTKEKIPGQFIEVIDKWTWSEDELVDFQADGTNDWLYFSAPESTEIKYPLRLYHGTSVRNWRAIQSSGELRTGCLASSHGYDIDMPDTYIDLAIGEIEDNHPDIKAGGLVLNVTFPDQATADQYLEADTTMYDLGMAVLEDDLYHRYAPADWQPADAQEGWHYSSWNWFGTDFQDLVKSNQATKTIPYSPQDLSDWQASYLSVYSVCIKQPIPLKYITVDWGSESRRAEEETSKTVGEAWDKALVKWYEIVDWAKQERETGIRDVSTTEFQQAIEVYNILYPVSNKITEPHFRGSSSDKPLLEQLIKTYASDDLELEKTLIEHYEEFHRLTEAYVVKSKTMNYFFYYGLIEWIIMMNWRLTSLNSYGGKELDDAISSQFQESTLKAYRWISVGNDEVPSRNINFNNYADFSYGAHWSLHPEVYTRTIAWEGAQYQKDYLIEKDVPVEDIDWFETLISCLFFLDSPELEIIMKPMTFIAETLTEPHLYLDMDGCFADFAGAITQRVNDVLQVQDVSEISSKSLRRAARKAKELGITSVTERDFDLSLSHDPIKKKVIDRMLYKIASEPGFFYNLEVMNRDVLDEIIASRRPFSFLSAPIGGTKDYSIEDKRAWVRDRLGLDVTVNVVPRDEKVTFCQPGDVLIDDHVTTISEWTAAGGHGVLFPQEIDEFLRKPYNGGTTTYQAEEVEKVKQYPIVYKKNATGTLQQWQVLLLPQESGGYLLTTASGKVGGKITQGRGKLIKEGKVNRTALEQAELQADSKFKKKKDEGYFPTKEEAHQNLVLLPMKALDFKKRSHDITYPAVAQRKFDGVRCLAIPQADGSVRLMSRTGKTWTHLHHLQSQIEALNLDSNMVLDGEVYSDTLTFEDATGLVRRQTLKPGDEEKMKQIDYRLYDAILLDQPNATFLDRYVKLAALFPPASSTDGRRMGHLVLTENFPLRNREDLLALHRQFTTDEDFEGVMVRNLHGTYDINKRSKHLQKFKEFQDAEYKIVGYNEASGDWQGTPIWICEMADGRQFNVTPTGDRPSRIEMFNNIEDYMGKLLTVKFFELTADGVPRHGVGLAIRDYE